MGRAPWLSLPRGKRRRRNLRGTAREPQTEASLPHDSANTHSLVVFLPADLNRCLLDTLRGYLLESWLRKGAPAPNAVTATPHLPLSDHSIAPDPARILYTHISYISGRPEIPSRLTLLYLPRHIAYNDTPRAGLHRAPTPL
jgi:hypothetical protein